MSALDDRADATSDAQIAAIVAAGRATRRRPSRGTWIAAVAVSAICALGFVLLIVGSGAGEPSAPAPSRAAGGCAGGLGLGIGLGIGIGFLLGRRQRADHSSRSRP